MIKTANKLFSVSREGLLELMAYLPYSEAKSLLLEQKSAVDSEIALLFLDRANELKSRDNQFLTELSVSVDYPSLSPLFKLSLLESVAGLNLTVASTWNGLFADCTNRLFLNNLSFGFFPVILQAFETQFNADSSVAPEEVFEAIEIQLINRLKSNEKLDLIVALDLYCLFAKNLEGSRELYSLIQPIIASNKTKLSEEQLLNLKTANDILYSTGKKDGFFSQFSGEKNSFISDLLKL